MADLEWMLCVIMLSGFIFAAIARFNLHYYLQQKRQLASIDRQQYLDKLACSSPEVILDYGVHQLAKYFITGVIIFLIGSATLVDSGALKALVTLFFE